MDLERLQRLIDLMDAQGLSELSLELPDYKVSLKRAHPGQAVQVEPKPGPSWPEPAGKPAGSPIPSGVPVVAPMVGVFHLHNHDNPALQVGNRVEEGEVIGAIECMRVPNEIRAPISGVVASVLVEEGVPVEYGQTLAVIAPQENGHDQE